jgi:hypothetical protein
MAETQRHDQDVLETLACDITARPAGAPGFADIAGAVRSVRRDGNALIVDYDPAVAETLAAVVEAERQCCEGIGWHLLGPASATAGAPHQLHIEARPEQLDILASLIR